MYMYKYKCKNMLINGKLKIHLTDVSLDFYARKSNFGSVYINIF